jgi:hypothetical protein
MSMRSTTSVRSCGMLKKPCLPREPASAISKTFDSASSSSCAGSRPEGLYAESAMAVPTSASCRITLRSRTISA